MLIDASGPIYEGMWSYGAPFKKFKLKELKKPDWVEFKAYAQEFEGFDISTGSYINGPAHALGIERSYPMHGINIEKLFNIDAYVLKFDISKLHRDGNRPYISLDELYQTKFLKIPDNAAIIIATGWGEHWQKNDFLTHNRFLRRGVAEELIKKRPFLLAVDTPALDNFDNQQGLWNLIYGNGVLVVAPLINLEKLENFKVKLFVCPLNILNTAGLPCRVIIKQ